MSLELLSGLPLPIFHLPKWEEDEKRKSKTQTMCFWTVKCAINERIKFNDKNEVPARLQGSLFLSLWGK